MSGDTKRGRLFISRESVQEYLQALLGKEAVLSCGYGGVIFLEAGDLKEQKTAGRKGTVFYGSYSLFCDENWKFSDGEKTVLDRWHSSGSECDSVFEQMGKRLIREIKVEGEFDFTHITFDDGSIFTIVKDDSIDTFQLTLLPEKKRMYVNGDGSYELNDYEEDRWWRKETIVPKKKSDVISVSRDFLRDQMPDLLSISKEKTDVFVRSALGETVRTIDSTSATRCTLRLGRDYRETLPQEQRKHWATLLPQWYISLDELWILKKDGQSILDVSKEKFHFRELLQKSLVGQKLLSFTIDPQGRKAHISFSDAYVLEIQESGRFTRWSVHNYLDGFSVGSYRDSGLNYRISIPIHLSDKYSTEDVHLSHLLYEVDFYRSYFGETKGKVEYEIT